MCRQKGLVDGGVGGLGFLAMEDGRACLGVGRPAPGEESWRLVGRERSRILEKLQGEGIPWGGRDWPPVNAGMLALE